MTYWSLTESDIDRIAIGVGILGTGGGGSPYLQMLIAKQLLREGKRFPSKNRAGLVREIKEGEAAAAWGAGGLHVGPGRGRA